MKDNNTSKLYILDIELWESLILREKKDYHLSDVWQAEDLSKPLSMLDAKSLHHFANQSPVKGQKILFIHSVDSAKADVLNSLLKIIEEPPPYLQIILLAESGRILPTILSRVIICKEDNSAKIISEKSQVNSSQKQWENVLEGMRLDLDEQKTAAQRLLYLSTLRHNTVQTDNVLEGYLKKND